jgi:peptide/nickel transport system permease protein
MLNFVIQRFVMAIFVAITVSIVSFLLLRLSGDLAYALAGQQATEADVEAVRQAYGLDRPLIVQYGAWLLDLFHGDLGRSFYFRRPVSELILERLPVTLMLGFAALLLALLIAIPFGVAAAIWRNTWVDRLALLFSALGQSMPSFWIALLLVSVFGITLRWTPISGSGTVRHFILPVAALAFYAQPTLLRLTRAGMIEVLQTDYIRTARAKGLARVSIIFKHALRNALMPVVAISAVQLGHLLGGSIVIETIFAIHGIGYLAWESIQRADFPVVQSILLLVSCIYVLLTFGADLLNAVLDPKLRVS